MSIKNIAADIIAIDIHIGLSSGPNLGFSIPLVCMRILKVKQMAIKYKKCGEIEQYQIHLNQVLYLR